MNGSPSRIANGGRLVIPAEHRRALGLEVGDEVLIRVVDGELRILPRSSAVKQAQDMIKEYTKGKRSLVDELIAERRAEAKRE